MFAAASTETKSYCECEGAGGRGNEQNWVLAIRCGGRARESGSQGRRDDWRRNLAARAETTDIEAGAEREGRDTSFW